MKTTAIQKALELVNYPISSAERNALVKEAREELAALSSVPEDVARDVELLTEFVKNEGATSCTLNCTCAHCSAISRLATAAARVPGLEAEVASLTKQANDAVAEMDRADRERDATRQEVETANDQLQAVHRQMAEVAQVLDAEVVPDGWGAHAAAQKRMAEHRALTARVAELEASLAYVKASSAKAEADLARYKMTADSLNAMWEKAEARATAAEKEVKAVEDALWQRSYACQYPGRPAVEVAAALDKLQQRLDAQSTPAPGLREAVGRFVTAWKHDQNPQAAELHVAAQALLVAYDATPPVVTHAQLAAVVEEFVNEHGSANETLMRVAAREVLRRVTGVEVPRVLLESEVRAALTKHLFTGKTPEAGAVNEVLVSIARDLHLAHEAMASATHRGGPKVQARERRPEPTPEVPALAWCEVNDHHWDTKDGDLPSDGRQEAKCTRCPAVATKARLDVNLYRIPSKPAQAEPAAPEVVHEAEGVRVLADGGCHVLVRGHWVEEESTTAHVLARALAEAKRENRCDHGREKDYCAKEYEDAQERAARKAAEDMRERAAETADGGPLRVRGVLMTPRERILALPLEDK